ncbi:hypothetical protein, partial [Bosea sp. (in: a-proteobacteria)]|uniref:hypothetical protein n=1 Tax=Bosea sp. (in: a-proteobacteria) TaxID=1871050 RepID=UPI004033EC80
WQVQLIRLGDMHRRADKAGAQLHDDQPVGTVIRAGLARLLHHLAKPILHRLGLPSTLAKAAHSPHLATVMAGHPLHALHHLQVRSGQVRSGQVVHLSHNCVNLSLAVIRPGCLYQACESSDFQIFNFQIFNEMK